MHAELQQTMNDLVGIIRARAGGRDALGELEKFKERAARVAVPGERAYNPGWHYALDLRNMLLVAECVAMAALEREESRGGHTREDYPEMSPEWRKVNLILTLTGDKVELTHQPLPVMRPDLLALFDNRELKKYMTEEELAGHRSARPLRGGGALMGYDGNAPGLARRRRVGRARRLQGRGQRGRGRPRRAAPAAGHPGVRPRRPVELQGRQVRLLLDGDQRHAAARLHDPDVHVRARTRRVTITPMRTFPVIRDLVTDVSFNYAKAREIPSFTPDPAIKPGEFRMQQDDVNRSQEFRKCIECFLCQNTCHVVRDHEENKDAFAGPRFLMRVAELEMHPADEADRREHRAGRLRPRLLQHHQVLHRGLPRAHQDHRQRAHPDEGARRRAASTTRWSGSARRSPAAAEKGTPAVPGKR